VRRRNTSPGDGLAWQTSDIVEVLRFTVGQAAISRVPYFDVAIPPEALGLTADQVTAVPWAVPDWATSDGRPLVGQAVWVIESEGSTIVVDPCGAADAFIRTGTDAVAHQDAVLAAMASAGFDPEQVDTVVLTHLDGIGMAALLTPDGRWVPAFPQARLLVTEEELRYVAANPNIQGARAFGELVDAGVVDGVGPVHRCTAEVAIHLTGGHTPGHGVVHVESGSERAVMLGHLALSPIHAATRRNSAQHTDPDRAARALDTILGSGALMLGSLWPAPGAGRAAGKPWTVTPMSPA
jgi:glyoxylase-like metal-dependent hydrolase (beta-lactamase superfamily II)